MRKTVEPDALSLRLPPLLQPGDTIGLFCPAGPVRDISRVESGIAILQEMGFQIRILEALQTQINNGIYLSATDSVRTRRLHTLWNDRKVKALMAVRGGYGCLRLAGQLEFSLFRENPKLLIGFSDLTVLLAANSIEAGLIGLHGPVVSSLARSDSASRKRLFALLTGVYKPYIFDKTTPLQIIRSGIGRGRIVVGNLTTLVHLIGTPWEPVFDRAIMIIEDTGESMYKVDRMLTQLACSNRLSNLAGLILGTFDMGGDKGPDAQLQQQISQRVTELTELYEYPVWSNFPIGHQSLNQAIPYGMEASMESNSGVLTLHPPGE
jgi:muramoyltetrapeptide carboxypeptidase